MTTGITIGLSISGQGSQRWTAALAHIGGHAPFFHFDAPRQLFALDEGGGLRALTAAQLATRITSTSDSHAIEDGLGRGVGHNTLIAANGLPLTKAGLQGHPTIVRPHGEYPVNGGALSVTPTARPNEGIFHPMRVAGQGAVWNRWESSYFSTTSGAAIGVVALLRAGTSGRARIVMRNNAASTSTVLAGALGAFSAIDTSFGAITALAQSQIVNGDWLVSFVFTPNVSLTNQALLATGPDTATVGAYVDVIAAQATDRMYPYTDWIMGGTGAVTLPASRNTLPASGALAFAAELDMRAWTSGAIAHLLDWNDGSANSRVSLRINASGNWEIGAVSGGSSLGQSTTGAAAAGTVRLYGVAAANYLRVGRVSGTDGVALTSSVLPAFNRIAFDGVGYDTTTARAFKYLKRFAQWSVSAGNDSVFGEVKAVAQGWI